MTLYKPLLLIRRKPEANEYEQRSRIRWAASAGTTVFSSFRRSHFTRHVGGWQNCRSSPLLHRRLGRTDEPGGPLKKRWTTRGKACIRRFFV
jgi:hypothetical protein